MYIAQAKCLFQSLMPYHFYYQKLRAIQRQIKKWILKFEGYLHYIEFNINIYGGGRGIDPRQPLSPCPGFKYRSLQPDLGIIPLKHNIIIYYYFCSYCSKALHDYHKSLSSLQLTYKRM